MDEVGFFNTSFNQGEIQDIIDKGLEEVVVPFAVSPSGKLATAWASIKAHR